MACFRNRLVHIYWDVDNNTLYNILKNNLQDLDTFLKAIIKLFSDAKRL